MASSAHQQWPDTSMRAYVWDRCLLLQARTLVVDRRQRPYKRLSATIIVANRRPFILTVSGGPGREHQGVVIAPNVTREYIEAVDSDVTFLDAGITTAAYRDLEPHLVTAQARSLTAEELARIQPSTRPPPGVYPWAPIPVRSRTPHG